MTNLRWIAGSALALSACTLFTNLDGLGGAAPAPDASIPDASVDTSPVVPVDSGSADACDADFCDDFDEGQLEARWTSTRIQSGRGVGDDELFVSPPRSFRATTTTSTELGLAYLVHDVGFVPRAISCTFQIHPNTPRSAVAPLDFFQIIGDAPGVVDYEAKVAIADFTRGWIRADINFSDGGCGCPQAGDRILETAPPVGVWTKVQVDYDYQTIVLRYADTIVYSGPFPLPFKPSTVRIALGIEDHARAGADVSFDDLSCRFIRE